MKDINNEDLDKIAYQSLQNFATELRKDVRACFGDRYKFSDIFYKNEFSNLFFDYLDDKYTKEEFKDKLKQKISYAKQKLS